MVARLPHEQKVVGSSPTCATNLVYDTKNICRCNDGIYFYMEDHTMDKKQSLLSMYEHLNNSNQNLNLYLSYIEKYHPIVFKKLNKYFEGMPGYVGKVEK